jgi:hypothetical protein
MHLLDDSVMEKIINEAERLPLSSSPYYAGVLVLMVGSPRRRFAVADEVPSSGLVDDDDDGW